MNHISLNNIKILKTPTIGMVIDSLYGSLAFSFKLLATLQQLKQKTKNSVKDVKSHPFYEIMDKGG